MKLYHGSNCEINDIDLKKGKKGKDFGQGFYLSEDLEQALKMAQNVVDREECGVPTVTIFEFDESLLKSPDLKVRIFDSYSIKWVRFIRINRNNKNDNSAHSYDIVYGPIANDNVGLQMRRFDLQLIDEEHLMNELKYKKATFQYYFGTEAAISQLKKLSVI